MTELMIFTDLALGAMIGYFVYLFYKTLEKPLETYSRKQHYVGLYDLYKLNEELKERNLSFESLDDFEKNHFPKKKDDKRLSDVDKEYEKNKEVKK